MPPKHECLLYTPPRPCVRCCRQFSKHTRPGPPARTPVAAGVLPSGLSPSCTPWQTADTALSLGLVLLTTLSNVLHLQELSQLPCCCASEDKHHTSASRNLLRAPSGTPPLPPALPKPASRHPGQSFLSGLWARGLTSPG